MLKFCKNKVILTVILVLLWLVLISNACFAIELTPFTLCEPPRNNLKPRNIQEKVLKENINKESATKEMRKSLYSSPEYSDISQQYRSNFIAGNKYELKNRTGLLRNNNSHSNVEERYRLLLKNLISPLQEIKSLHLTSDDYSYDKSIDVDHISTLALNQAYSDLSGEMERYLSILQVKLNSSEFSTKIKNAALIGETNKMLKDFKLFFSSSSNLSSFNNSKFDAMISNIKTLGGKSP